MRILLDTQAWLWLITEPERVGPEALRCARDPNNTLWLSAVSSCEIAIKYALGKLPLPEPPEKFVPPRLMRDGILALPVNHTHALRVAALPLHHRDPFDRLLVAQAQVEGLCLLTTDRQFEPYDLDILWAG